VLNNTVYSLYMIFLHC